MAKAAAMMTSTELLPTQVLGSAWPQHFNKVVAETTYANMQTVGLPAVERRRSDARQGAPEGTRRSARSGSH